LVGAHLKIELDRVAARYAIVGAVHGMGL